MKTSLVFLEILVFVSLWQNGQGKLWNGRNTHTNNNNDNNIEKPKSHPRRRLTELTQETVDVDAATGSVKVDDPNASNCDGQLAQALVAANDKEFRAKQERDQALKEKAVAMEELHQLRVTVQSLKDTIKTLGDESKSSTGATSISELQELVRTKDDTIAALQAKLESVDTEKSKQLEEKLAQVIADAKAKEVEYQTQMENQRKIAEELLETTRDEAKRVLIQNVATIKEQMKESEKKFQTSLAEKDEVIKQVKAQNDRFSKFNQEMLDVQQAHEKVCVLIVR